MFLSVVLVASSCNRDEVYTTQLPPEIILDSESGVYTVTQGEEIRIAPQYKNVEEAEFEWVIDKSVVCTDRAYVHYGEEVGSVYLTLTVTNPSGSASEQMRIDVVEPNIPTVDIVGSTSRMLVIGTEETFRAEVRETGLPTTLHWYIDDKMVGEGDTYKFVARECGKYSIVVKAQNSEGEASDSVRVEVVEESDLPVTFEFDRLTYHTVVGRKLLIAPSQINPATAQVVWYLNGGTEAVGGGSRYIFVADSEGEYTLTAVATFNRPDGQMTLRRDFEISVYAEDAFLRPATPLSSLDFERVYEYMPAPGQFIGDQKTAGFTGNETTATAAAEYAEARLRDSRYVSLGAFGGYIVVGFDHSIERGEEYDFAVLGNSFDSSSEPGVVWVMQDENGNSLPDDTWYELRGSESGASSTISNYAVTYYRPTGNRMDVYWEDNQGGSGTIDYLEDYHNQYSYYPLWIEEDSYTLQGTRLEARNYDKSGNGSMWIQPPYDWGYADNFSAIDCVDKANMFKIENAIDFIGDSVELSHIDFVKVQCAVQSKSGWVGELSTEVCGIFDIN